jgi:hypothetical protein
MKTPRHTHSLKVALEVDPPACLACGARLDIQTHEAGRVRRYCNDACRMRYKRGTRPGADGAPTLADLTAYLDYVRSELGDCREHRALERIVKESFQTRRNGAL